jgi:hypothetical protein
LIINLTDSRIKFKALSLGERDSFHLALKALIGEVRDSEVMRGGDLSAFPSSLEQQEKLLNLTEVAGRSINCSLPVTANPSNSFKGIIFEVPIPDKEEDILEALADQNVVHVKRLPMKGHPEIFSENVILTFSSPIPDRVKIAAMSYRVKQSIPSPFRCKKCWHLGHSTTRCSSSTQCCKKCGKTHPPGLACITCCVNCRSPSHESENDSCPAFQEMKAIIKTATIQGISIQEARSQHNRLYSRAVHAAQRAAPAPPPLPPRSDCINPQIAALQAELKNVKDTIIPSMSQSINSLTAELAATKEKISLIDTRFDSFESQLGANASSQSARFDKLEQLISSLTNAIKPQVTP